MTSELQRSPYTFRQKAARMLWATVQHCLFRTSFHNWYRWRRFLLSLFGAKLGQFVRIRRTVRVECPWNLSIGDDSTVGDRAILYCLGPVRIGTRSTVSQGAHLCAGSHDYTQRSMPLLRPKIDIGDDVWVCADAFVGPGVEIGDGAILGARAVAMKSLQPWTIYSGNPAKAVRERSPFID